MEHNKGFEKAQREFEAKEDPRLTAECPFENDDDCPGDCDNCEKLGDRDPGEVQAEIEEANRADYDYDRQKCREGR